MKHLENIFKFMQTQLICSNNVRHFYMTIYTNNFCLLIIKRNQSLLLHNKAFQLIAFGVPISLITYKILKKA